MFFQRREEKRKLSGTRLPLELDASNGQRCDEHKEKTHKVEPDIASEILVIKMIRHECVHSMRSSKYNL